MNEKVIIIGASGHGKVVADIILKSGDSVVGFIDDNPKLQNGFIGFPVLGTVADALNFKEYKFVIAIGNADIRERIANELDLSWYTAIHPNAVISSIGVEIGEGTVVMANAVINSEAKIGSHCIINTGAIVEHDNRIDDFTHISVGVSLAGNVSIGRKSWIGIGSQIIQGKKICPDTVLGAGAVVIEDIQERGTYVGVPARRIMKSRTSNRGGVNLQIPQIKYFLDSLECSRQNERGAA